MNARVLFAAAIAAVGLFAACSGGHSGFYCPENFSSDVCAERVASANCADGGTVEGPNDNLCCAFDNCASDPFPEAGNGP